MPYMFFDVIIRINKDNQKVLSGIGVSVLGSTFFVFHKESFPFFNKGQDIIRKLAKVFIGPSGALFDQVLQAAESRNQPLISQGCSADSCGSSGSTMLDRLRRRFIYPAAVDQIINRSGIRSLGQIILPESVVEQSGKKIGDLVLAVDNEDAGGLLFHGFDPVDQHFLIGMATNTGQLADGSFDGDLIAEQGDRKVFVSGSAIQETSA